MHTIQRSYRGLSLLMELNWDRVLYVATIAVALAAGAFIGTL
jgi:asparagine N-glycosylation enzyme membrane subunit Stt3